MPTRVIKVIADDYHRIYDSLLRDLNPNFTKERWEPLFHWGWDNPEDHIGYALETDSGDLVGFLATIYSLQQFGKLERVIVCNVSSWVVIPGYRSSALALVMPVLRRRDVTVTNLTSLPEVNTMFRKLGFATLETHTCVLLPRPKPFSVRAGGECLRIDPAKAESFGDTGAVRTIRDHRLVEQQWILRLDGVSCHVVLTLGRRRRLRTARIHHVSDPKIFREVIWGLRSKLLKAHGVLLCEWDERLLGGLEIHGTRRVPLPVPRIFRSDQIKAKDLSNLYSELPLLKL